MSHNNGNWVHLFQILNTGKHKEGFTLYEVTSMVYSRSCPDAITKIVVWKRYNDFKILHNDLKKKMKSFKITDRFPALSKASYFKRFSDQVIAERKSCALTILEFVAKYPVLFMSDVFVKFFESSYIPTHQLKGKIDEIRDELHLPIQPDIISVDSLSSGDERLTNNSDIDSISTRSNLSLSFSSQGQNCNSNDSILAGTLGKLDSLSVSGSESSLHKHSRLTSSDKNLPSIPEQLDSKSQSNALYNSNADIQYMVDASIHIAQATEFEVNKEYDKAFTSYKLGIGDLVNGVHNDRDVDRKQAVRHKIAKYLLQAEKIYNIYLNIDIDHHRWNDNVSQQIADSVRVERPISELFHIKVVDIVDSKMLVRETSSQLFIIKSIYKHVQSKHMPILPLNIPFMVKLYKYYNTEQTIYVLLEYISTGRLWDYITRQQVKNTLQETQKNEGSIFTSSIIDCDGDSDNSYGDLINDYKLACNMTKDNDTKIDIKKDCTSGNISYDLSRSKYDDLELDTDVCEETKDLLVNSQKLLNSVSEILHYTHTRDFRPPKKRTEVDDDICPENISISNSNYNCKSECWSDECKKQWEPVAEHIVSKWAAQLVVAVTALHNLGIFCLHLNPNKILINKNGDIVLTYIHQSENPNFIRCLNYPDVMYSAPEINGINPISKSSDWWSLGTLLYELLTGLNFYTCHPGGVNESTVINIPNYIPNEASSLLTQLLLYSPEDRLGSGIMGSENIKTHPFFKQIDWEQIISR